MEAIFNFRVEINNAKSVVTMSQEKVENMEISTQQALLKIFMDVEKKVRNLLEKGGAQGEYQAVMQKTQDIKQDEQHDGQETDPNAPSETETEDAE